MALLTADDVHYKTFTPTKFREGYDPDEVDEFLDQVVSTIVELQEQNEALKAKGGAAAPVAAEGPADDAEVQQLHAELASAKARIEQLEASNDSLQADLADAQKVQPVAAAPEPAAMGNPEDATAMLALAQRVHDEYVRNGEEEGNRIVADCRVQGEQIVREANDERQRVLDKLEGERSDLEHKVDDLKQFEREYRSQIRSHLETLIQTVDTGSQD